MLLLCLCLKEAMWRWLYAETVCSTSTLFPRRASFLRYQSCRACISRAIEMRESPAVNNRYNNATVAGGPFALIESRQQPRVVLTDEK